jgi:hypothetical protein
MQTYKTVTDVITGIPYAVLRSDGWQIPFDPSNTDYQAYLKWLDEGNTPEAADAAPAKKGNE